MIKNYLIIYGFNTVNNLPCISEHIVNNNELDQFKEIIELIKKNTNIINWEWTRYIQEDKNGNFIEKNLISDMYPTINKNILNDFAKLLPSGITKIKRIEIFKGEKIQIL